MILRLPDYGRITALDALDDLEPLQATPRKVETHAVALARGLPSGAGLPARAVRALGWVPPTARRNAKVAVHYLTACGDKSEGVAAARVDAYLPEGRQVRVRLAKSGERKVVPVSWVLDPCLGGTQHHPWQDEAGEAGVDAPPAGVAPAESQESCSLAALKAALLHRYGSLIDAWEALDPCATGTVDLDEFVHGCRCLDHDGDLTEAFDSLASALGGGPDDAATLRHFRAWMAEVSASELSQVMPSRCRPSPTRRRNAARAAGKERESEGAQGIRLFRSALHRYFHCLAVAWRAVDTNRDGVLQFREFCNACRKVGFHGNLKQIWEALVEGEPPPELDEDGRAAKPERLDPKLPELLRTMPSRFLSVCGAETTAGDGEFSRWVPPPKDPMRTSGMVPGDAKGFRDAMIKKFGNLVLAWAELSPQHRQELTYEEFVTGCRRVDFRGAFRQIFADLAGGRSTVFAGDLDPGLPLALRAFPPGAVERPRLCTQMGGVMSARLVPEDPGPRFEATWRRAATTMREVRAALLEDRTVEGPPADAASFQRALVKKFGGYSAAWAELDARGRGALSYRDFVVACRALSLTGNLRQIFRDLTGGEEVLRLRHLRPPGAAPGAAPNTARAPSRQRHA